MLCIGESSRLPPTSTEKSIRLNKDANTDPVPD
jgi:hypothetical protein